MGRTHLGLAIALLVGCGDDGGGSSSPDGNAGSGDAPGAGSGLSAGYPGDVGIGGDSRVIFADDFESYATADDLWDRWDNAFNMTGLTRDAAGVFAGTQALELIQPAQDVELSNGVAKEVMPKLDVLYLRYYSKFEATNDITGSSHNGVDISGGYFVNGNATPGVPADGTNKFLIAYENWRGEAATTAPGDQNIYIYHPDQRSNYGDHFFPDGTVLPNSSMPGNFGPDFVARPNFIPELGRWYAFEVMLRANTPGMRDGRVTCWVDGEVIADFPNLELRTIPTLQIDRFGLSMHARSSPTQTRKWFDNVVAATAYIGPMQR